MSEQTGDEYVRLAVDRARSERTHAIHAYLAGHGSDDSEEN